MNKKTAFLSLALLFGMANTLAPSLADAAQPGEMLRVYMNNAKVLRLDRPVAKVIIGNATIADATVADDRTVVLTGKSFGATNLLLLDVDGNAIVDQRILVSIDEGNTVRLYKQTDRSIYSCAPWCEEHVSSSGTNP